MFNVLDIFFSFSHCAKFSVRLLRDPLSIDIPTWVRPCRQPLTVLNDWWKIWGSEFSVNFRGLFLRRRRCLRFRIRILGWNQCATAPVPAVAIVRADFRLEWKFLVSRIQCFVCALFFRKLPSQVCGLSAGSRKRGQCLVRFFFCGGKYWVKFWKLFRSDCRGVKPCLELVDTVPTAAFNQVSALGW